MNLELTLSGAVLRWVMGVVGALIEDVKAIWKRCGCDER
jgi:hypothetical protein